MIGGFRWQPIVAAFSLTFLALIAGHQLYDQYMVRRSIEQKILATGLVKRVDWSQEGELLVYLNPVSDLRMAYQVLETSVARRTTMRVLDQPSVLLETVYRQIEPALYEAAALSNFTSLAEAAERAATAAGLEGYSVQVDERRIYLSLHHRGAYLYRIVPRHEQEA